MDKPMAEVYRSRVITFIGEELVDYEKAYIVVDGGKIKDIKRDRPEKNLVDLSDYIILPGFVDTHTHLAQIDVRAKWCPDLLNWLEKYVFPAEMNFQDKIYAQEKALEFFYELVKNGTTTASVFSSPYFEATDIAFETARRIGIRAIMGQVMMDINAPKEVLTTPQKAVRDIEKLSRKWHGYEGRLFYAATPRFALSCSMKLMRSISEIAIENGVHSNPHF